MSEGLTFYKSTTRYLGLACLGSVIIGVLMPCCLVLVHSRGEMQPLEVIEKIRKTPAPRRQIAAREVFYNCASMAGLTLMFCGPGAVVLGAVAFGLLHKHRHAVFEWQLINGIVMGAGFSFLNLPGYFSAAFLDWSEGQGPLSALRLILLFTVTGATCGSWIAWQVWRSDHDGERFLPRYTLKTLMLMVLGWALLLALFKPMQK